jgi:recombination protein RecA
MAGKKLVGKIENKLTGKAKAGLEIAVENIKGFAVKGARAKSSGNVPTGHFNLDFALHFGELPGNKDLANVPGYDPSKTLGLPLGRVVEIFGDEGSGKSSICYRIVGNAQKKNYKCLWFDAEQSFSEALAVTNGVDLDELYLADKGSTMEQIMDNIIKAIESGIKLIIVDSVAGLVPQQRMEGSAEDQTMALKARILSENLPKIATKAGDSNCLVIFINQIREKPGISYGPSDTTQGGKALPFFASVRLRFSKRTSAKEAIFIADPESPKGRRYIGHYSGLKIEKNRFAKPVVDADGKRVVMDVPIYFEPYFPNVEEAAFNTGRQVKVIAVRKETFSWRDIKGTKDEFIKNLEADQDLLTDLIEEIKDAAQESETILPPEITTFVPGKKVTRVAVTDVDVDESELPEARRKKLSGLAMVDDPEDLDLGGNDEEQTPEGETEGAGAGSNS